MSAADDSPAPGDRQSEGDAAAAYRGGIRPPVERRASGQFVPPAIGRASVTRAISLYAVLFGGVLVLLLVALVLEDAALREAHSAEVSRDAEAAAAVVERSLAARVAGLEGLRGLAMDGERGLSDARLFRRVLPALGPDGAPLLDRVLVGDRTGRPLHDTTLAGDSVMRAAGLELLQLLRAGAERPAIMVASLRRASGVTAIIVPLAGDSGVVGIALGAIRDDVLLRAAVTDEPPRRRAILVAAGADTLLFAGAPGRDGIRTASTLARLPDGAHWEVEVVHDDAAPALRPTLWLLGGSALFFLVLGLARERRQARNVVERSAELERLSTELLRSNRMKSEFLANISHELRTPLNAIVGFVELLKDGVYGELSPRQINPVDRIAGSATHLRHLVDQVLDIAKMAAGRLEVHLEPVVLRPFVLEVASELESLAADKGIVLSLTVSSSLPRVRTDPSHLRQILVNLIGNAIKYTPEKGSVAIRTRLVGVPPGTSWRAPSPAPGSGETAPRAPIPRPMTNPQGIRALEDEVIATALAARSPDRTRPWIAIQVSDTGIGIAPEHHERIFEEFEQVDAGPRGESMERGTGLGLPISRRLARLLGGDVTVDSNLGRGAVFTLWLPVELPRPAQAP